MMEYGNQKYYTIYHNLDNDKGKDILYLKTWFCKII